MALTGVSLDRLAGRRLPPRGFLSIPLGLLLDGLVDEICRLQLPVEIGLAPGDLARPEEDFARVAKPLRRAGLPCTLHAPFAGLDPGSQDPAQRQVTWTVLERTFDLAALFRPRLVVCHANLKDGDLPLVHRLALAPRFWAPLVARAATHRCPVVFENTFEPGPDGLRHLLDHLDRRWTGFCLDTGHLACYATADTGQWLAALGDRLRHLHLHDNNGDGDHHLAPGHGNFPFAPLFAELSRRRYQVSFTLEPHHRDQVAAALAFADADPALHQYLTEVP